MQHPLISRLFTEARNRFSATPVDEAQGYEILSRGWPQTADTKLATQYHIVPSAANEAA